MWGGNERKETKMTQTLAWAAGWVLASCTGVREKAHPQISASCAVFGILRFQPHVLCLESFGNTPMEEGGPAAQKDST